MLSSEHTAAYTWIFGGSPTVVPLESVWHCVDCLLMSSGQDKCWGLWSSGGRVVVRWCISAWRDDQRRLGVRAARAYGGPRRRRAGLRRRGDRLPRLCCYWCAHESGKRTKTWKNNTQTSIYTSNFKIDHTPCYHGQKVDWIECEREQIQLVQCRSAVNCITD